MSFLLFKSLYHLLSAFYSVIYYTFTSYSLYTHISHCLYVFLCLRSLIIVIYAICAYELHMRVSAFISLIFYFRINSYTSVFVLASCYSALYPFISCVSMFRYVHSVRTRYLQLRKEYEYMCVEVPPGAAPLHISPTSFSITWSPCGNSRGTTFLMGIMIMYN